MDKKDTKKLKNDYWAIVRVEILANHFEPVASFDYYCAPSKLEVAELIVESFTNNAKNSLSNYGDEDLMTEELDVLNRHFESVLQEMVSEVGRTQASSFE